MGKSETVHSSPAFETLLEKWTENAKKGIKKSSKLYIISRLQMLIANRTGIWKSHTWPFKIGTLNSLDFECIQI